MNCDTQRKEEDLGEKDFFLGGVGGWKDGGKEGGWLLSSAYSTKFHLSLSVLFFCKSPAAVTEIQTLSLFLPSSPPPSLPTTTVFLAPSGKGWKNTQFR